MQPNTAVEEGEVDANYFQHQPYLDDFNKKNGTESSPSRRSTWSPSRVLQEVKTYVEG